jgi:RNase adaptor protein for sRNA GlmZ degradation
MNTDSKIDTLRKRHIGLESLPDTIRVPALGPRREEVVKRIEDATVDDVAFAILALDVESDAVFSRLSALRRLHTLARKNGALGVDLIAGAVPMTKEGR